MTFRCPVSFPVYPSWACPRGRFWILPGVRKASGVARLGYPEGSSGLLDEEPAFCLSSKTSLRHRRAGETEARVHPAVAHGPRQSQINPQQAVSSSGMHRVPSDTLSAARVCSAPSLCQPLSREQLAPLCALQGSLSPARGWRPGGSQPPPFQSSQRMDAWLVVRADQRDRHLQGWLCWVELVFQQP